MNRVLTVLQIHKRTFAHVPTVKGRDGGNVLLRQYMIRGDIYMPSRQRGAQGAQITHRPSSSQASRRRFFFFAANGIQLWRHTWAAATPAPANVIYSSCWWPAKTFFEVRIAASSMHP